MNLNDISVACSALGTAFDAPVVAIGAVAFDRTTGKLGDTIYREIELNSAIKHCRVDAATLAFWIKQNPIAKSIFGNNADQASLATVLLDFMSWCRATGKGVPRMWSHGAGQDITWLEHAVLVGSHGISPAWHPNNVFDVRTIIDLATEITAFDASAVKPAGETALDKATHHANVVSSCYAALRRHSKGDDFAKPMKATLVAQPKITKPLEDDEL